MLNSKKSDLVSLGLNRSGSGCNLSERLVLALGVHWTAGDGQVIGDVDQRQRVYSGWVCLISEMGEDSRVTGIASPSVCHTSRSTPEFELSFVP